MFEFVSGDAHAAAVRSVREVSRGGSLVTHWQGGEQEAAWSMAATRAGEDTGPFY